VGSPVPTSWWLGPEDILLLDKKLCQVVGLNLNYVSATGTLYHIQIEDRGPILDVLVEREVRRVNVIVYANYGEPNARIIHGRDHDFEDIRLPEYNRYLEQKVQDLAAGAKNVVEEKERRQVERIKALVRQYYLTKDETAKREFEDANAAYPFLFSRAWKELKDEKVRVAPPVPEPVPLPEPEVEAPPEDVLYPLDPVLRERVLDIERIILELGNDLQQLKAQGAADDILLQTCRKLVSRAKESLTGRDVSEFSVRRLDMTRNSLMTTWRQVKSRFRA
jgi:hypothetical protein